MASEKFKLIAAVFVLFVKNNKILLSERKNTGWEDGKYSLIGGHMDGGETAVSAAMREAAEEVGVEINPSELKFVNVCHLITNDERIHFSFAIEKWVGEPENKEPEKSGGLTWFDIDNLPKNISEVSKETISWYKNKTMFYEYGWNEAKS